MLAANYEAKRLGGFQMPLRSRMTSYGRTVFLAVAKSRTLEPLAFDEYCRFDTSEKKA